MDLSVVVPTLNGRDQLAANLDALAAHAPDAEVVVVNGPSADGTTGMVRDRDDVDVLVEVSARTLNVARNAGIEAAAGDVVALLRHDLVVEPSWCEALADGVAEAPVVTGPTHRTLRAGMTTETSERDVVTDRDVVYFDGGNVAFEAPVLDRLDGFDEYLETGGSRDLAHRLAGLGYDVAWRSGMSVRREYSADGGVASGDAGWKYRALAYRLVKNYGLRPTVATRTVRHAVDDAVSTGRDVLRGEVTPTTWAATGRDVLRGVATGAKDGFVARADDRTPRRNPKGISSRDDRAVARYDWR
ncbi:glycosyltransferase family 2 protein [Salinirarus marinus]|uniref:glycosyltransferase family 2 protein n=1 Tax=Salinirarus marinus TaxID=3068310 RepID=UPI003C6C8650